MRSEVLAQALLQELSHPFPWVASEHTSVTVTPSPPIVTLLREESEFFAFIEQHKQQIDCLVLQDSPTFPALITQLKQRAIVLPVVVFTAEAEGMLESRMPPVAPGETFETAPEGSTNALFATEARAANYHAATITLPVE